MASGQMHGIARYALELARRLPALEPSWKFVALTGPGSADVDLAIELCSAEFLSPFEQPLLAAAVFRSRCDLFHATSFSLPLLWPGKLVATLHDANHLALANEYGRKQAAYYRVVVRPRARFASALITVSEFSRSELSRWLDLSPYRFQVIGQGVSERF